jgi:hypothetical protein
LMKEWNPMSMLPQLHKDRDIKTNQKKWSKKVPLSI